MKKLFPLLLLPFLFFFTACPGDDVIEEEDIDIIEEVNSDSHENTPTAQINSNGHKYVDLGLSVYWAERNIGEYSDSYPGDLYAFGELQSKDTYKSSNYIGWQGDIVSKEMGGDWRLPTLSEYDEIIDKCKYDVFTRSGYDVLKVVGPNGNYIYFPYSSYLGDGIGYMAWYWTSSPYNSTKAGVFHFDRKTVSSGNIDRYNGFLVRGVLPKNNNGGTNTGGNNSGGTGTNSAGNTGGGSSSDSFYCTNFTFNSSQTTATVNFDFNERVSSATIKYGKSSASSFVSSDISAKRVFARITGLTKGTTYKVKCTAKGTNGLSYTADDSFYTNP